MFDKKLQCIANFYKKEIEREFEFEPEIFLDNK